MASKPALSADRLQTSKSEAVVPLRILSIGVVFVSCKRMLINYNRAFNDLKINIGAQWAGVIMTIILDVILIPMYGIVGAAWASVFSYFITALVLAVDLYKRQGVRIKDLFAFKPGDIELVRSLIRNYLKKLS